MEEKKADPPEVNHFLAVFAVGFVVMMFADLDDKPIGLAMCLSGFFTGWIAQKVG